MLKGNEFNFYVCICPTGTLEVDQMQYLQLVYIVKNQKKGVSSGFSVEVEMFAVYTPESEHLRDYLMWGNEKKNNFQNGLEIDVWVRAFWLISGE